MEHTDLQVKKGKGSGGGGLLLFEDFEGDLSPWYPNKSGVTVEQDPNYFYEGAYSGRFIGADAINQSNMSRDFAYPVNRIDDAIVCKYRLYTIAVNYANVTGITDDLGNGYTVQVNAGNFYIIKWNADNTNTILSIRPLLQIYYEVQWIEVSIRITKDIIGFSAVDDGGVTRLDYTLVNGNLHDFNKAFVVCYSSTQRTRVDNFSVDALVSEAIPTPLWSHLANVNVPDTNGVLVDSIPSGLTDTVSMSYFVDLLGGGQYGSTAMCIRDYNPSHSVSSTAIWGLNHGYGANANKTNMAYTSSNPQAYESWDDIGSSSNGLFALPAGERAHIVLCASPTSIDVYRNGVFVHSYNAVFNKDISGQIDVWLGKYGPSNNNTNCTCDVSDMYLFKEHLTAGQALKLYEMAKG